MKEQSFEEKELLAMISGIAGKVGLARGLRAAIGDDAAVFRPRSGMDLLLTTDAQVEGIHFRKDWLTPYELGRKLAAVNLSDLAAMGGDPLFALLSLSLPPGTRRNYVKRLVEGVVDHLGEYDATLAGGNLSGSREGVAADLTLVGECPKGSAWMRRCRPGRDAIVVVGDLGDARAGLEILKSGLERRYPKLVRAFKRPEPLLEVARLLRRDPSIHGAMDVSDGFATDLVRLLDVQECGCVVDASRLPFSKELERFCRERGVPLLDYVLGGGEDYALVLSVSRRQADKVAARVERVTGIKARVVGEFRPGNRRVLKTADGTTSLTARGWDHFAR
jgi:thiamine-monophosphate kinase